MRVRSRNHIIEITNDQIRSDDSTLARGLAAVEKLEKEHQN